MEISSSEFSEWIDYLNSEPSPDQKRSYESANVCLTIAKAMGGNKRAKLEDFLLKYNTKTTVAKRKADPKDLKAKIWTWLSSVSRKKGK